MKKSGNREMRVETIVFEHQVLVFKVGISLEEDKDVKSAVISAWKVDKTKAANTEFILAVNRGVVVGVFYATEWLPATPENFPNSNTATNRWGFRGDVAPREVVDLYFGKRLPDTMRLKGAANPVKYAGPANNDR